MSGRIRRRRGGSAGYLPPESYGFDAVRDALLAPIRAAGYAPRSCPPSSTPSCSCAGSASRPTW